MQQAPQLTTDANGEVDPGAFTNALDLARDQDQSTWVTGPDGKRAAALVPVEVLEFYENAVYMRASYGRHASAAQS